MKACWGIIAYVGRWREREERYLSEIIELDADSVQSGKAKATRLAKADPKMQEIREDKFDTGPYPPIWTGAGAGWGNTYTHPESDDFQYSIRESRREHETLYDDEKNPISIELVAQVQLVWSKEEVKFE